MKLSTRLVMSIIATSVIGLLVAFIVVNSFVRNAVLDNILESVQNNMTVYASELDSWFVNNLIVTDTMAITMSALDREHVHYIALNVYEQFDFVAMAYVGFGVDDTFDSCSIRYVYDWVLQERPWFIQGRAAGGETVFTNAYVNWLYPFDLVISVVRHMPDWYDAVVAVDFILSDIADVLADVEVPGDGYVFILDNRGYIANHPNPDFAPTATYLRNFRDFPIYAPLAHIIDTSCGITTFINYNGIYSYMMTFAMSAADWTLVSIMPTTVTSEPVFQILSIIMITFFLILFVSFAFILLYIPNIIGNTSARINNRIRDFKDYTTAVAKGLETDKNLDIENIDTSFGLDKISTAFDENMREILALIKDMTQMHRERNKGNYTALLDPNNYAGAYEELARNHNNMVEELAERLLIINESIEYASVIQQNLLPDADLFKQVFSDYAIKWEPRDVVGGDMYWIKTFEAGTVLCVADCTGHGTAGALLTMLVGSAFEDLINEENCSDTAQLIWNLEKRLLDIFGTRTNSSDYTMKDGCDMVALFIAKDKSISLSACNTNFFICNGKKVERVKGQYAFIGEGKLQSKDDINTIQIPFDASNKFYISSDGLFEQPGGAKEQKYGYREFEQIILENHNESQSVITDKVWEAFEEYRGEYRRVDDFELIAFTL
ncbi:MAG: SpoIIE family protein phosphatase [Defluviitaleaceae bacterium]|nr:SpoIIE family protein phosphatase [Defluviitaleaceae bacterium]